MREKFENRKLTGNIRIACKYENAPTRYWETTKEEVVLQIRSIVSDYSAQGHRLSLRQLHYQLVGKNWIINHQSAYNKLGDILDDCRYAGIIDWNAIEDRGRRPHLLYHASGRFGAMDDMIGYFRLNRQKGQSNHVELWSEKDALSGIFSRITEKYHIRLVVNKGYSSSSAIHVAYKRFAKSINEGRTTTVLYFGDHDPSGLDMIRDIRERILLFLSKGNLLDGEVSEAAVNWWQKEGLNIYDLVNAGFAEEKILKIIDEEDDDLIQDFDAARLRWYLTEKELFRVVPIGLTMEQIKKYKLPENPTKMSDSRSDKYIEQHGRKCWEVDALSPTILTEIVEEHMQNEIDMDLLSEVMEKEAEERGKLEAVRDRFREESQDEEDDDQEEDED